MLSYFGPCHIFRFSYFSRTAKSSVHYYGFEGLQNSLNSNALFLILFFCSQSNSVGSATGAANSNTWISNLLPAPKNEDQQSQKDEQSLSSQQTSKEPSPVNTPVHNAMRQSEAANVNFAATQSPQKPVNLLPEVPETANSAGRKLSEREKRDCEVIGKLHCGFLTKSIQKMLKFIQKFRLY